MTEETKKPTRLPALIRLLEIISNQSAKTITYTTALLGIFALVPGIKLPPELALIASGIGVEAIGSLLDRVAHNDKISEDEIKQQVELAIAESGFDKLITRDSFFHAYSHILKKQNKLNVSFNEIENLLHRIEASITPSQSSITYGDVRQIAQDVFESNMYRLSGNAYELAWERGEQFTDFFLGTLASTNAAALRSASDPDFQYALFHAQQAYARSGDQTIFTVLVDILVERASASKQSFLKLAQNEALVCISKLVVQHFNALSLIFLLQHGQTLTMENWGDLIEYLQSHIIPCLDGLPNSKLFYLHIENIGCVTRSEKTVFPIKFTGIHWTPYPKDEVDLLVSANLAQYEFFKPIKDKYQFLTKTVKGEGRQIGETLHVALDQDEFRETQISMNTAENHIDELYEKYSDFCNKYIGDGKKLLLDLEPRIKPLFDIWDNISDFSLTAVGMMIALSNLKRLTGESYNIYRWVK
ncbi:MAG: hypothetical protein CVU44_22155 [Chloroflexi bacterium HGW-Chloroflexi-6]|nr:MAG: hypothetical protein CVU44_22155 [Chloroflexi bacterium HGW-Chloroflexi-6]